MKQILLVTILAICMVGCVSKGYVPHYIVTDSKEPKPQASPIITDPTPASNSVTSAH